MRGTPVWLASLSRTSRLTGLPYATGLWTAEMRAEGERLLKEALAGVGDPTRERLFRMNVTLCLHRALTADEVAGLPTSFHQAPPVDLAGGPVEVLWETEEGTPSTRPCVAPHHIPLPGLGSHPMLWLPGDCGACEPCRARAALDDRMDEKRRRLGLPPAPTADDLAASAGLGR